MYLKSKLEGAYTGYFIFEECTLFIITELIHVSLIAKVFQYLHLLLLLYIPSFALLQVRNDYKYPQK